MLPKKLQQKINQREAQNTLRELGSQNDLVDFSSNDYLGFAKSESIFNKAHRYLTDNHITQNGATGSRLLSGNHTLYTSVETMLCEFHNSEAALIFNSGYDANLGFFSAVPQRGDIILYDEFIHASIRDGIQLTNAKAFKFKHNDLSNLEQLIQRHSETSSASHQTIYIVTESVFSMDGDSPDFLGITQICNKYNALLVVDEAHALGVLGYGLIQEYNLEQLVFARIITFGKALGCHGAAILGSKALAQYLVNFSRAFIYTTALPPHTLATIKTAYEELNVQGAIETSSRSKLQENIHFFKAEISTLKLQPLFITSDSAIQCCIISGNNTVKNIAQKLQDKGYNVKAILSPTVPEGQERLRFCLHSYNTKEEISKVLNLLSTFAK